MIERALRKAVLVNTADEGGGAERMSMATLDGFTALGTETWLLVGRKETDHPFVLPLHSSPFVDYRPYSSTLRRSVVGVRRSVEALLGLEDFNHPYAHRILDLSGSRPDVVICDNLHGGYFDLRAISALSQRVPVVLRLFDSWLFTGHCAIPLGCSRWQTGCGRCPDLGLPPAIQRDATRVNWRRKARIFGQTRVFVVTESEWLLERARRSLLAPAVEEWKVIRGGVDLETFSPGVAGRDREALGIDPDAYVLLTVANLGTANPYKDFATLREALRDLAGAVKRPVAHIVVGADGPSETLAENVVLRRVGYLRSPQRIAAFYRAADLYVHAAIEEPFGLSVAEALACGTPVVTASEGGVCEIVENGHTGIVVPPRRPAELREAIVRLLADPDRRRQMGSAAAASARAKLDRREMVRALHAWCEQIVASQMRGGEEPIASPARSRPPSTVVGGT